MPRSRRTADRPPPAARIEDLLREGQEIIVQVAKEPLGTKGARLTSHVTIPGRFLVFMPTVDHVGVSRKIDDRERAQPPARHRPAVPRGDSFTGGLIIRTAAAGRPDADIIGDLRFFHEIWTDIRRRSESSRARPRSIASRASSPSCCATCSPTIHHDPHRQCARAPPRRWTGRADHAGDGAAVKLYSKTYPIFDEYGVQAEIDKALRSKVWLKSGGYIVINQTEALVAIDVNTGRYVGKKSAGRLEDTIVKTNLEAVQGDRPADSPARPGRHHRPRLHRHGGAEEPPEGVPGDRAGAEAAIARRRRRSRCRISA